MLKKLILLLSIFALLSGCTSAENIPAETAAPSATAVILPTNTATTVPTETPKPTKTPSPTYPPRPTPFPMPVGSEALSPENVSQIELLDWRTYGGIQSAFALTEGSERIGRAYLTLTHLIGLTFDGALLYELLAPFTSFFSARTQGISADQKFACILGEDGYTVDVYRLLDGEKAATFDHLVNFPQARFQQNEWNGTSVDAVAFSPDGSLLAVAYYDTTISLWDMESGIEYSIPRTFETVMAMTFSPSGQYLAVSSGFFNSSFTLFDVSDPQNVTLVLSQNDVGIPLTNSFSPDGKYLFTAEQFSNTPNYAIFDLETMSMVQRAATPMDAGMLYSRDGEYLIFIDRWSYGDPLLVVELATGKKVNDQAVIDMAAPTVSEWNDSLHADAYMGDYDEKLFFYTSKLTPYQDSFRAWNQTVFYSSSDVRSIGLEYWTDGEIGQVRMMEMSREEQPEDLDLTESVAVAEKEIFYCEGGQFFRQELTGGKDKFMLSEPCLDFSEAAYDSVHGLAAYVVDKKLVEVMDVDSGEVRFQLRGFTIMPGNLKFSEDGNWIAVLSESPEASPGVITRNQLMLFALDHESGEAEAVPLNLKNPIMEDYIAAVDLSADGGIMAAGIYSLDSNTSSKIQIWDFFGEGAKVRSIPVNSPELLDLSPDASLIAVASGSTVYVYSVQTSELLAEYSYPYVFGIGDLMFTPDGKSLVVEIVGAVSVLGLP